MNSLAAWGPTIVSAIVMVFTAGIMVQRQNTHDKRLDDHDQLLRGHGEHLGRVDVALVKLEEYQKGWEAAIKLMGGK